MTDLTKASEALLSNVIADWDIDQFGLYEDARARLVADLRAIEAAVRSDTLADVAARLPEALAKEVTHCGETDDGEAFNCDSCRAISARVLAHLTGGTR